MTSSPSPPSPPRLPDFRDLDREHLRRAIATYLALAYPAGEPPPAISQRVDWPDGVALPDLVSAPPFEQEESPEHGGWVYALRLGNAFYPNMKLQLQPWPTAAGYLLSVNTHDQILDLPPDAPGMAEFRAVQERNQALKEAIETAWDEQGFPTFNRYLRDMLTAEEKSDG